ncbi:MAG: hypothetical protein JRG73_01335 [Deltaproteobacteria bacterium]|nr:hypothetical protein [Deltaproteobacteria bacterium]MBW2305548.1 hypothetical protein [Deltaproteobacteria bacterium]
MKTLKNPGPGGRFHKSVVDHSQAFHRRHVPPAKAARTHHAPRPASAIRHPDWVRDCGVQGGRTGK